MNITINQHPAAINILAHHFFKIKTSILLLTLFVLSQKMNAQYGRAYSNMPTNSNLFQFTSLNTSSNTLVNEDVVSAMTSRINTGVLTYVRTLPGIKNRAAGIGFVLPISHMLSYSKTTDVVSADFTGISDPSFTFDHNIFGAKAMKREEFIASTPQSYGGLHAVISLPWGQYDTNKTTNMGANRYSAKLTYQQTLIWEKGKIQLDFYGYGKFFSDNKEYAGSNTLSQKPLYGLETYFSYNTGPKFYPQLGVIWNGNGATYINDIQRGSSQNNWKAVGGFGGNTWKGGSLIATYTQTFYRPENTPKIQTFSICLLQVF